MKQLSPYLLANYGKSSAAYMFVTADCTMQSPQPNVAFEGGPCHPYLHIYLSTYLPTYPTYLPYLPTLPTYPTYLPTYLPYLPTLCRKQLAGQRCTA